MYSYVIQALYDSQDTGSHNGKEDPTPNDATWFHSPVERRGSAVSAIQRRLPDAYESRDCEKCYTKMRERKTPPYTLIKQVTR